MVLHDPMVREIAVRRPAAHFGLARIVGKEKAARYGAELRSTLRSFAASTGE
jgi:hypothetical protein